MVDEFIPYYMEIINGSLDPRNQWWFAVHRRWNPTQLGINFHQRMIHIIVILTTPVIGKGCDYTTLLNMGVIGIVGLWYRLPRSTQWILYIYIHYTGNRLVNAGVWHSHRITLPSSYGDYDKPWIQDPVMTESGFHGMSLAGEQHIGIARTMLRLHEVFWRDLNPKKRSSNKCRTLRAMFFFSDLGCKFFGRAWGGTCLSTKNIKRQSSRSWMFCLFLQVSHHIVVML